MNMPYRFAIALLFTFFSLSAFSHQFLPTEAKLALTSEQDIVLTIDLDLIEMAQQAISFNGPLGEDNMGFMSDMDSLDAGEQLIQKIRTLSNDELGKAFRVMESNIANDLVISVDGNISQLTSDPFPSVEEVKLILSQPPEFTEYRLPLNLRGSLPKGSQSLKIKFPSAFGFVKLSVMGSSKMLVGPSNFSLPISLNYSEKGTDSSQTMSHSEDSSSQANEPEEGPTLTDSNTQAPAPIESSVAAIESAVSEVNAKAIGTPAEMTELREKTVPKNTAADEAPNDPFVATNLGDTKPSSPSVATTMPLVDEPTHTVAAKTPLPQTELSDLQTEESVATVVSNTVEPSVSLSVNPSVFEQVSTYLYQGVLHIIPKGLDHILFVLALFLLSTHLKPLLWQVTVFTLAHTITLLLAGYQVISVSAAIVEPLIALSIAFVALENVFHSQLKPWRIFIIFAFGLLHGLGFASVLLDLGLPQEWAFLSLVSFNVGVEVGQLLVVAGAFLVVGWFNQSNWYRKAIVLPGSALIAAVGLVWTFERVVS